MKLQSKQSLGLVDQSISFEKAAGVTLRFPYGYGISYGTGTAQAPDGVIDASWYLESYDEVLKAEFYCKMLGFKYAGNVHRGGTNG